jgi:uncharacterized protein YndB with AHSA1/START domain
MATRTVEVAGIAASPPQVVWDLLADVDGWSEWGLFDETRLVTPGEDDPDGLGARRFVRADRMRNLEEVFIFEPPRRLAYIALESSLPVRNHRSDVQLSETTTGGTEIWWRSSYEAKIFGTGWMIDKNIRLFLADTVRRLAVRADTGAPAVDD